MLAAEQLRQQQIVARINQIGAEQQQLELEKQQLTKQLFISQGRVEAYQQMSREPSEEEKGAKDNITEFPAEKAPKGKKGKGRSKGPAKD